MDWKLLKDSICPKCKNILTKTNRYYCTACNFSISIGKVYDIVGKPKNLEQEANKLLRMS